MHKTQGQSSGSTTKKWLGEERVNQLNKILAKAGRTDDIIKAAENKDYQNKLFEEFNL